MRLWIAGRRFTEDKAWEILGLYSSEEAAGKRCTGALDVVGPISLDEDLAEETIEWPGAYYPKGQK